jgi:hypothetical protein
MGKHASTGIHEVVEGRAQPQVDEGLIVAPTCPNGEE